MENLIEIAQARSPRLPHGIRAEESVVKTNPAAIVLDTPIWHIHVSRHWGSGGCDIFFFQ